MTDPAVPRHPPATESVPPLSTHPFCAFGPFVVDRIRGLVWRHGTLLSVARKSFDVLAVLLDRPGQVVEKAEIFARVWCDTAVEDNTLARHVATLRKLLGESADQHTYIATIPGHGYRFVAPVTFLAHDPQDRRAHSNQTAGAPASTDADGSPSSSQVQTVPHTVLHAPSVRRWRVAAAAAVLATIISTAVWFSGPRAMRGEPRAADARSLQQITFALRGSALGSDPTWSPAGNAIAYTSYAMGNADIWVQAIGGASEPVRITTAVENDFQGHWSPDGQRIVFRSDRDGGGLYVVGVDGTGERRLTTFGYQPQWSPDGSRVLFVDTSPHGAARATNLYVVVAEGGTPEPVRSDITDEFRSFHAAWFPTGLRVSLWGRRDDGAWQFLTANLQDRNLTVSNQDLRDGASEGTPLTLGKFVWAPSMRFLYFEGRSNGIQNVWRVPVDPATLAWQDAPERLTSGPGSDEGLAITRDGKSLAFTIRRQRTMLWAFPFDASTGRLTGDGSPAGAGGETETNPTLASDGSKIAYEVARGPQSQLWERSLLDGTERLLLTDASMRSNPHWSHDGAYLAYVRVSSAPSRGASRAASVVVLPTNGEPERVVSHVGESRFGVSDWSPDGQWLIGTCGGVRTSVCLLPVTGTDVNTARVRNVAADPARHLWAPRLSPNQRWVSFHVTDEHAPGATRMYIAPVEGGPWTPITDGNSWDDKARWAPDGRTLYFVSNRSGLLNVWGRRINPATGQPVDSSFQVTSFRTPNRMLGPSIGGLEIGIGSNRLVAPLTEASGHIWSIDSVDR